MKRLLLIAICLMPISSLGQVFSHQDWCQLGGMGTVTNSLKSKGVYTLPNGALISGKGVQASFPGCQVDVYDTGTLNHSTIFSNVSSAPLANPFTANADGSFLLFAAAGCYDIVTSHAGMPTAHTESYVCLGGAGGAGGGTVTSIGPPVVDGTLSGTLAPLLVFGFDHNTTDAVLEIQLSNVAAHKVFGNGTGISATPTYFSLGTADLPFTYSGNTTLLATVSGAFSGTGAAVCRDASGNLTTSGCTGSGVVSFNSRTGVVTPQTGDYVVANIAGAAPTASPALTGVPTAPTAAPGTNTAQLATTAFVIANGSVTSFNARTGAVTPQAGDYGVAQVTGAAPSANPSLTGVPLAPTAAPGTNSTQIATTAFVLANPGSGSVKLAPAADQTVSGDFALNFNGGRVTIDMTSNASGDNLVLANQVAGGLGGMTMTVLDDGTGQFFQGSANGGTIQFDVDGTLRFANGTSGEGMAFGTNLITFGRNGHVVPPQTYPNVFALLPVCGAGTEGTMQAVTDSSTSGWGAVVTGGGTNHVLAYCDGTDWTVAAL